ILATRVSGLLNMLACNILCLFFFYRSRDPRELASFPTRRSSDLREEQRWLPFYSYGRDKVGDMREKHWYMWPLVRVESYQQEGRSEEHTSELQSRENLVCRLLLEKKKKKASKTNILGITTVRVAH